MQITIQKAKNDEETACIDGHFLHSNYAPSKEAERFVENLQLQFNPSIIIISEPGLSYSADYLRKKYPGIKIGAIRYTDSFNAYNDKFDFVLNYYEHTGFEAYLESKFTEEELLSIAFIRWNASSQIFTEEDKTVWENIKAALVRAKTLLITRQYFEKKWFLNSCHFLRNINNQICFDNVINKDVLIISSGPSLIPFLDIIKNNQNKFFIICLSSAITACLKYNIIPDLCMSTDGGFWAGEHLKILKKHKLPLAIPSEAFCSKKLLKELNILPLDYGDGISSDFINCVKLPNIHAVRNGTVSGTALLFAASYFTKNIYLCGMDMANQKGFQHTQPNQLEINSSLADNRIKNKASRLSRIELTNGSLDIYKDWFYNNPLKLNNRKVYRLIEEASRKNTLGWISDINLNSFTSIISDISETNKTIFDIKKSDIDLSKTKELFSNSEYVEKWKKQLFPLSYVQLAHNPQNVEIKEKINSEWKKIKKRAGEILYENI